MAKVFLQAGDQFQLRGGSMMSVGAKGTIIGGQVDWDSCEAYRGKLPDDKGIAVFGCIQLQDSAGKITHNIHLDHDTNSLWYNDQEGY